MRGWDRGGRRGRELKHSRAGRKREREEDALEKIPGKNNRDGERAGLVPRRDPERRSCPADGPPEL